MFVLDLSKKHAFGIYQQKYFIHQAKKYICVLTMISYAIHYFFMFER